MFLIANILLGGSGYLAYIDLGVVQPFVAELATLAVVNLIALWMRWKLPKTWQKMTGESID